MSQPKDHNLFHALGGREGCDRLATAFYAHVAHDPILRPLYPPRLTGCPRRALADFLTQFFGGPYDYADWRWSMSLQASHQRFVIGPRERAAWLAAMFQAIDDIQTPEPAHSALRWVFHQASASLLNHPHPDTQDAALAEDRIEEEANSPEDSLLHRDIVRRWEAYQMLEQVITAIGHQETDHAVRLLESRVLQDFFSQDRAALLQPLALLSRSQEPVLHDYMEHRLKGDPALVGERYMGGRTLLHEVAGQSNIRSVVVLVHLGADPNARDRFGHTPLYEISNAHPFDGVAGATVVTTLVQAGANVNDREDVNHCTALHMAARRGNVRVAHALLRCGADIEAQDKAGDTPLHRAVKCRQAEMVAFLCAQGANGQATSKNGQTPWHMARGERVQQALQTYRSQEGERSGT